MDNFQILSSNDQDIATTPPQEPENEAQEIEENDTGRRYPEQTRNKPDRLMRTMDTYSLRTFVLVVN